jgi:hypothetical protein
VWVKKGEALFVCLVVFDLCRSNRIPSRITVVVVVLHSRKMMKKRKSEYSGLDEVEKTLHTSFCTAANSISHLYTQAQHQQKHAFQAGERHAVVGEYTFKTSSVFFFSRNGSIFCGECGLDPNPNPNLVLLVFNESVSGFCYVQICALYLTMLLLVVGFMDLLTSVKSPFDSVGNAS